MIKLVSFDAFGTLFRVWPSVAYHYRAALLSRGVSNVSEDAITKSFQKAFKKHSAKSPNFGHGLPGGDTQWWEELVKDTLAGAGADKEKTHQLPTLLHDIFSTPSPFILYPEVPNLIQTLRSKNIIIGVISDSDSRTPPLLDAILREENVGLDFVVTSYEVGEGKTGVKIFEEALSRGRAVGRRKGVGEITADECLHVGDSYEETFWDPAMPTGTHFSLTASLLRTRRLPLLYQKALQFQLSIP
ncbi:HAD-like domain-containing protein [Chytridium lagenaria]|nr:HAD-like domain-containing protein [Chytridium lagenaria]